MEQDQFEPIFTALSEHLQDENIGHLEIVVCGGAALNVLGLVSRVSHDVDIVALVKRVDNNQVSLELPSHLDQAIVRAAHRVQKIFDLRDDWLSVQTAALFTHGLPEGLLTRAEARKYGSSLTIHFLSRYDQIHFKLFAALSSERRSVHVGDLLALSPSQEEMEHAALWALKDMPNEFYGPALKKLLTQIGYKDVSEKI